VYKDNFYFNCVTLYLVLNHIFFPVHRFPEVSKFKTFIMTLNFITHAYIYIYIYIHTYTHFIKVILFTTKLTVFYPFFSIYGCGDM
jgi:hypothetical protein